MSLAAMAFKKVGRVAPLAALVIFALASAPATADPCADGCRGQHNACRMAAKLLYPARCDAQLQACISQCFAAGRFNRDRKDREHRGEFRERHDMRVVPPEGRGPPPDARPPPPDMRGPPGDYREPGGLRWLGGRSFRDRLPW